MTVEQRAEACAKALNAYWWGDQPVSGDDLKDEASVIEPLIRAHEAEVIERCARLAYTDQPRTIYYSQIDVLETKECIAVRKQIARSIRALAQKGTDHAD